MAKNIYTIQAREYFSPAYTGEGFQYSHTFKMSFTNKKALKEMFQGLQKSTFLDKTFKPITPTNIMLRKNGKLISYKSL